MELFAGFDLGGSRLKYGLIDENENIVSSFDIESPRNGEALFQELRACWQEFMRKTPRPQAVGLGFPGIFSSKDQKIRRSPHFPRIENLDLRKALSEFVSVPFFIDNEANLAAYGEFHRGGGRDSQSLILLTIGSGIGTGIILDGRLWRGACGYAGELGHAPVNPRGEKCRCGNRGCLETEISAGKIVRIYRSLSGSDEALTAGDICRRAENGDKHAAAAFTRAGHALGTGLAIAINVLNPERILLGGGVMEAGELLLQPARESAQGLSFPEAFACCSIGRAEWGNKAGFMGAALWAKDNYRKRA